MIYQKHGRTACLLILLLALLMSLSGCETKDDGDSPLNNQADYSVNIALPYATVTPPPASQTEAEPLVIDDNGSVTVNDAVTVLESEQSVASDSNFKSLRQGNTGLAVQALQSRLKDLGYYTADISGIFDDATEAAVRRFEQTYGTMQTGVATSDFQTRLFASNAIAYGSAAYNDAVVAQYQVLKSGDVGSAVYALQQRLRSLGYPIETLTGIYDDATVEAIRLFYKAYNLAPSDVANVALQKELYSDNARSYGSETSVTDEAVGSLIGQSIGELQARLIELGYLRGEPGGSYDARTEIAVKLFEEAHGRLPSITMDDATQTLLFSDDALAFDTAYAQYSNLIEGASGEDVLRLQKRLVALGFVTGTPTGEYAAATTAAMRLFQQTNMLEETGVAGRYDQAVLFSSFALNINGEIPDLSAEPDEIVVEEVDDIEAAPVTVETGGTLSAGASGDRVLDLQNRLTNLGYVSSVTGNFDNLTARAVMSLQTATGVEPTGEVDDALYDFIFSDAAPGSGTYYHTEVQSYETLQTGDSGDEVTNLQKRLWKLGYLDRNKIKNSVGQYDDVTAQAVTEVQQAVNMDICDGIARPELLCYLNCSESNAIKR